MTNWIRQGSHYAPKPRSVVRKRPIALAIASIALALGLVGGTIAYIVAQTGDVENTFEPGSVNVKIIEDFATGDLVKSNVKFENEGNVDAFMRATVVVNWVDEEGNYCSVPTNSGYTYAISYDETGAWEKVGNYWYHKASVPAEGADKTAVLVTSCTPGTSPAGYKLKVDVIVDAIQAEGTLNGNPVATEVWGVAVGTDANGNLYLDI